MRKNTSLYLIALIGLFTIMAMVTSVNALTLGTGLNLTANNTGASFYVDTIAVNASQAVITNNSVEITAITCQNNGAYFPFLNFSVAGQTNLTSALCYQSSAQVVNSATCTSAIGVFTAYPALVGLIGVVFLIGLAVIFIMGWGMVKSGQPVTGTQAGIFIAMLMGMGLLVIVGIVAIQSICSLGIIG